MTIKVGDRLPDGKLRELPVERPGQFEVSGADRMLVQL